MWGGGSKGLGGRAGKGRGRRGTVKEKREGGRRRCTGGEYEGWGTKENGRGGRAGCVV